MTREHQRGEMASGRSTHEEGAVRPRKSTRKAAMTDGPAASAGEARHQAVSSRGGTPEATSAFALIPIGYVRSSLVDRVHAPKQGDEGAPDAWLRFRPEFQEGLRDLYEGEEVLLITWLDRGDRGTLTVHPRDDLGASRRGVFSTRSQDRPNPLGLHRVRILEVASPTEFRVQALEAFDGTPIVDVKPVLDRVRER